MSLSSVAPTIQQLSNAGVAYPREIALAAKRHHLDPRLLAAVAAQETGGPGSNAGRNIVGDGGHGHGIFQIDDRWHSFARTAGAMNPGQNANYAASMIGGLLKRFGGNVHKALSAYNAGSGDALGTVTEWNDGRRLGYADSVLRHYARLGGTRPGPAVAIAAPAHPTAPAPYTAPALEMLAPPQPLVSPPAFRALGERGAHEPSFAGLLAADDTL